MAAIEEYKTGYRAFVYVNGKRESKMFRTKREANAWGAARETELRKLVETELGQQFTFAEAMQKYAEEVSPKKKGARWEKIRIEAMLRDDNLPSKEWVGNISTTHLAKWRDARLKQVKPATVLREIILLSAILETARCEWQWIKANPMRDMKKPTGPAHREILIAREQVRKMLKEMKYSPQQPIRSMSQAVGACFLLALRTGMRAGELCGLTWDRVKIDHCHLPTTKNGTRRDVPLTHKAKLIIDQMRGWDDELVFGLKKQTLDALFRKYRKKASLEGFTFHDSRHTAATWIAARMRSTNIPAQQAVFDLCKMFGWKNINQALVYYNPSVSDIAKRLN